MLKKVSFWVLVVFLIGLVLADFAPVSAQPEGEEADEPVLLRLKYATFDPRAGWPRLPESLAVDAYPGNGEGAYIVQFHGPIQDGWTEQIGSLGARVIDYLPDYAFLVWMDGRSRAEVERLPAVRWVGIYQPAFKLSPNLDRTRPLYRVVLFPDADRAAVEARLKTLNTPTNRVPDERFLLILPDGNVEAVAAWPEVLWIENQPLYRLWNDVASGIMRAPVPWSAGYTGAGQSVAVADSGIDSGVDGPALGDMHPDFDNRLAHISSWPVQDDGCAGCCYANMGANDGASDVDSGHGTHVLGSVGGNGAASAGQMRGLAYQATLNFQALEQYVNFTSFCEFLGYTDGYYLAGLPANLNSLFQQAYNWGARIHSDSWGSNAAGEYTADSQAVDQFMWNHPDMLILFSAGNAGVDANADGYVDEGSIGSPATCKNCISSGASDNERSSGGYNPGGPCSTWNGCWPGDYPANPTRDDRLSDNRGELAAFSSRGPADDGRIKPDLVAPGTNIVSARSRYISGYGWGPYANPNYMYMGGTSMANPLIAGAAALVREYYIEGWGLANPSAALIKATLINSAVDMAGYGNPLQEAGQPIPNHHEGWGRVDVGAATTGGRIFRFGSLGTGAVATYAELVSVSSTPLKVTLAWTDRPGSLPAGGLVNNLDLEVVSPGGIVYRGNVLNNGWSVPGGTADSTNNVESVYIQSPSVGSWTFRVKGTNVPKGPQPFALVVTARFGPPPSAYDHRAYLTVVHRNY